MLTSGNCLLSWVDKYRPQVLDDIVGNNHIINSLKYFVIHGNIPNLLLIGPTGIGKTTILMCLAKELLNNKFKTSVLEFNASEEMNIDIVRKKIKLFAKTKISLPINRQKLIILDEADYMTSTAQHALRHIMEEYSKTSRFFFACNNSTQIIEPIQSRCSILRLYKIEDNDIIKKLKDICSIENILYDDLGIETIASIVNGDLRKAINILQSCAIGYNIINVNNIYKIHDQPNKYKLLECLDFIIHKKLSNAQSIIKNLFNDGYASIDIIQTLLNVTKSYESNIISESLKLELLTEISFIYIRISEGTVTCLQLLGCLAKMNKHIRKYCYS